MDLGWVRLNSATRASMTSARCRSGRATARPSPAVGADAVGGGAGRPRAPVRRLRPGRSRRRYAAPYGGPGLCGTKGRWSDLGRQPSSVPSLAGTSPPRARSGVLAGSGRLGTSVGGPFRLGAPLAAGPRRGPGHWLDESAFCRRASRVRSRVVRALHAMGCPGLRAGSGSGPEAAAIRPNLRWQAYKSRVSTYM